jgi:hypothetical protein
MIVLTRPCASANLLRGRLQNLSIMRGGAANEVFYRRNFVLCASVRDSDDMGVEE